MLSSFLEMSAQLSESEFHDLVLAVRQDYFDYGCTTGCRLHKVGKSYYLLSIVSLPFMSATSQNQVAEMTSTAQIKAYLDGVDNSSESTMQNVYSSSKQSSSKKSEDDAALSTYEKRDNKSVDSIYIDAQIIQKSINKKKKAIQILTTFNGSNGEKVYVYFLPISKKTAKSKL